MPPASILSDLLVARSFDEIDRVCSYNSALRRAASDALGRAWYDILRDYPARDVRALLINHPELLQEIPAEYRRQAPEAYDFDHDPATHFRWLDAGRIAARDNTLSLLLPDPATVSADDLRPAVVDVVRTICRQFQHLVEDCGRWDILWSDDDRPRTERIAQRLFYAVAESYCRANNLGLTPEANAGSGPVDFKVNHGCRGNVLVELRRSGNSQLKHGYEKQLESYKKAEATSDGCFVILAFGDRTDSVIEEIVRKSKRDKRKGRPFSEVIVIVAGDTESASRR